MQVDTEQSVKILDRRKYTRVSTNNSISYILVDKSVSKIGVGTGKVINISQNGLMLQTDHLVNADYIYLVCTDVDNKPIPMIGKVVFSMRKKDNLYRSGINFRGDHKDNIEFRKLLIHLFHKEHILVQLQAKR
jgi:hypothetical protein